jgi:hypothetical protein
MNTQAAGSFDPQDHTVGGFLDDADVSITKAEVVEFDYAGQQDAVCAVAINFRPDTAETDEDERTEYYRIGPLSKFTPSADRNKYVPVGSATHMNRNSKASLFMAALKDKGFPMAKLNTDGLAALVGLHCHVNQVPMPEMKGIDKKDLKILIVTKILDTPAPAAGAGGGKKRGPKAAAAPAAAAPATPVSTAPAAAAAVEGAEDEAVSTILTVLSEKGGKANKSLLPGEVFRRVTDTKQRNAIIQLISNAAWIGGADRPWKMNGGELSIE